MRSARCARSTCSRSTGRVNQFDIYVGTSAGSLIAALAANGITPEQMMRIVNNQVPTPFRDIDLDMLLRPNYARVRHQGAAGCRCTCSASRATLGRSLGARLARWTSRSRLAEALPSGLYTGSGIEEYIAHGALATPTAPTTSACSRTSSTWPRPTSTPASGSCSAPRAGTTCRSRRRCAPRRRCRWSTSRSSVKGRQLIDGGIRSTTNVDIAVEAGAKFIVVVNPLVPVRQRLPEADPDDVRHAACARVSDMGFPQIGYQTFKLLAHQRLHEMARHWQERYPGVDIILIEPDPTTS